MLIYDYEVVLTACSELDILVDGPADTGITVDTSEMIVSAGYQLRVGGYVMGGIEDGLTMYRGDSYPIFIQLTDKKTKLPVDLTGCTFVLTVDSLENPEGDGTQLMQIPGVLSDPATSGGVTFTPFPGDTDFEIGQHFCDIQMESPGGQVRTVAKVKFTLKQDITK